MTRFRCCIALFVFFTAPVFAADEPEETLLKNAGLSTDGPALIEFLKQRSRSSIPDAELTPLIKQLGSSDVKEQSAASVNLVMRGPLTVPVLRRAVNDLADKALAERARKCLAKIEGRAGADLASANVKAIALKKPAGSVEALLAYLPFADDASVLDSIAGSLAALAFPEEKAHPELIKALEHETPLLRAASVEALSRVDHPEVRPLLAKRLSDPSAPVRKRAALSLAKVEDVSSIPVLVDLLAELSKADRLPVEEMLRSYAGETLPKNLPAGEDEKDRKALRDAWAGWWKQIDGQSLVGEFRSRTLAASEKDKVVDLIRKLGDAQYRIREKANSDLTAMGAKVLADLREAAKDPDSERARRAEDCITKILKSDSKRVPAGAARLLALRRPDGATAAMLAYLPYADDDDSMVAEVKTALTALALDSNGKPDSSIAKALTDPAPIRRIAAAEAFTRAGVKPMRDEVKKLLADRDLMVRQAAAAALVVGGERDAVPVLIDILGAIPPNQSWQAQDVLHQLAGDQSPTILAGETPDERKKYRDEWAAWWKANSSKIDLAKLTTLPGYLGYTLLVQVGNNSIGRVAEVGRDGKVRWQIANLKYPVDAFVLPGERVLITEWDGNRVAEWDFRGNMIWKKDGFNGRATNAQRLVNGNTFICTTNELLEINREGKTVFQLRVNQGLTAGYRSTNGEIVCLRNDGQVVRYDSAGKELKTFASNRDSSWTSGLDVLRNGNILVTQPSPNQKAVEYTPDGKVVKEWATPQVTTASRLSNGHILAASHNEKRVTELDASGRKVWEFKDELHIFRARRR